MPIPQVASFAELNTLLLAECLKDDERQVTGRPLTIGATWELERQVEFQTNRCSVPAGKSQPHQSG